MNFDTLIAMFLAVVCAMASTATAQPEPAGHLRPTTLRCEYLHDPLGVETPAPRLSWIVESDRRAERQTAFHILVASSADRLARGEADLWDSGRVESDRTTHIEYAGKALSSRHVCYWKVRSWDRDGRPSAWSEPARWEMGLLEPEDWSAQWIEAGASPVEVEIERAMYYSIDGAAGRDVTAIVAELHREDQPVVADNETLGGDPAYGVPKRLSIDYRCDGVRLHTDVAEGATAVLARQRFPYLRKTFAVEGPISRARLYVTALGLYEPYLNGQRVGDQHLAPGWTDYRKRVHYQVYDVTDMLMQGDNALGALVGPGWFSGRAGLFNARQFYGETPALLAQLEITRNDGSVQRVVTDESWKRHDGPMLAADIMDGTIHDARGEIDNWCAPDLDDSAWQPVTTRAERRTLEASVDQPVRILAELPAKSVAEPKPGRWTFDLGQNIVGVVRLRVQDEPGTVITIRHGEILNPDGTIYTQNLRSASATDTYICRGGGVEEWTPAFTFHGFRYVEVTGLTGPPTPAMITGIVLGNDLPRSGTFECSDERLNQLQSNIVWGLRGNHVSIPTDCPQRDERMGWTGDAQAFIPTATYNADLAPFMTKWMTDLADAQRDDGAHSDVAPVMQGLNFGTPGWADAATIVPWTLYLMYGDTRLLETHIDSMMQWVDWCEQHSTGLIRDRARGNDYGDWLSIEADTPKELIGTAYFARSADLTARCLRVLGRESEADRYARLFDDIRAAFANKYIDAEGRIAGQTQTGYVLALHFGLVPEALRGKAVDHLVENIRQRGWRLSTGFLGVGHLLPVLGDAGRSDVAYRLLLQEAFPSWLFPVKHGATTIWERWDGWTPETGPHPQWGMNSFNHYALGSCGQWLFAGLGGIAPDPARPAFAHILIRPQIGEGLSWAKATFDSMRGEIATHWRLADDGRLTLEVVIPANATATVFVPAPAGAAIVESGVSIEEADGVEVLGREGECVVIRAGSGRYVLEVG